MKRLVAAYDGQTLKVDPSICDHQGAIHIIEVDGEYWQCPTCGATLDVDGTIVTIAPDLEEVY